MASALQSLFDRKPTATPQFLDEAPPDIQENDEEKDKRLAPLMETLRQFMQPPAVDRSTTRHTQQREREEEDINDFSRAAIRGAFTQDVPLPSQQLEQFNQKFRQSVSPAREMLANFVRGFGSSTTGQKFVSLRQEKLNEFSADIVAKQNEAKRKADLALQAMGEIRLIRKQDEDRDFKLIENATDEQARVEAISKFSAQYGLDRLNFNLNLSKFNQQLKEFDVAQMEKEEPKNPQDALFNITRGELTKKGVDLTTPEGKLQLQTEAFEKFKAYELLKVKSRPVSQQPLYRSEPYEDIEGNTGISYYNARNPGEFGTYTMGGPLPGFIPAKATPAQQLGWQAGQTSLANLRVAAEAVMKTPDFGGIKGTTPAIKFQNFFGDSFGMSADQRQAISSSGIAIVDYVKEKSGVQVTDRERAWIQQSFPQNINNQKDFVQATAVVLGPLMSAMVNKQYPQLYNRIDSVKYIRQLSAAVQENYKAYGDAKKAGKPARPVRMPTYQEFVQAILEQEQAAGQKFDVIRDPSNGKILGIR